jgi:hypothetical protein
MGTASQDFVEDQQKRFSALWKRQELLVLYGPSTKAPAIDIESKFTEAALGSVQISDYRNFAHGRHNWLSKRRSTSAVLAFLTDEDRPIAKQTLAHIPKGVPREEVDISYTGGVAAVAGIVSAMFLAGSAGKARGIDPGRPHVESFGRKIYRLSAYVPHAHPTEWSLNRVTHNKHLDFVLNH